MSQARGYGLNSGQGNISIVALSQTVTGTTDDGGDYPDWSEIATGDMFKVGVDTIFYQISAIDWEAVPPTLTLSAQYPTTVTDDDEWTITSDFTANLDIPIAHQGDSFFADINARQMMMIDEELASFTAAELDELEDVTITGPLQDRDALLYDSTSGVQSFVDRPLVEADISDLQAYLVAADLDDVVYDIASETLDAGTIDSGSYADLDDIGANYMSISEANGADPLTIRFGFTGVGAINQVAIRGYYQGSASHTIAVEIYNYTAAGYEILGYMPIRTDYAWYVYPLYNYTDYLDSGATTVRLRHVENGVNTHDLFLDYVVLKKAIW